MPYGLDEPEPIGAYLNGVFPTETPDGSTGVPALLSETGAFTNLATLEIAPGLIPYTLQQPFWSDGAEKFRWIALPNDGAHDTPAEQITFSEDQLWTFPPGTVTMKHFELPTDYADPSQTTRLETRFLVVAADGSVYGLTYRWNDDETDAVLLDDEETEVIAVRTPRGIEIRTWQYPNRLQCLTCHTEFAGKVIGPRTRQLNGDMYYPSTDRTANQLATWNHLGMFSETLDENSFPDYLTIAPQSDQAIDLEHRALSYLDSNCGYCHRPGGVFTAVFDARISIPLERSGIINGFALNNGGILGSAIVVPGDTSKSLIYQRMLSLEEQVAMPPLAKGVVDSTGAALMAEWILSLGEQTSIDDEAVPVSTTIHGAFPNPFSSASTASFSLAQSGPTQLKLFDMTGREVKTLLNTSLPRGKHEVKLDATNLSNGAYILQLRTSQTTQTHIISLLK